ncbi:hypothetical protein [uncultured virus]|uniref:Uncharacterized protein n=1 Tax=uncultured virus TaxID=340016 RepID=A0A218MM72_9VIRU|nr:hypothetical protein [uncultured virus]
MAAKYLYFDGGSNNAMTFPVDRLLAMDQMDDTSVQLTFEHVLGTSSSFTKVDLTVDTATEKSVMKDISEAIAFGKDQFVVIADSVNGNFINSSITAVSVDDSGANNNGLSAGLGITEATGEVYHSFIEKNGNIIKTSIYIDLTGLRSTAADDIIGNDGTSNPCHIGQIVAASSGTIFAGTVSCLETPAGGDDEIDLYSATEGTGAEDTAISTLTETKLLDSGSHAANAFKSLTAFPAADEYLYLVAGDTTNADYTAGKLLIELYGTE